MAAIKSKLQRYKDPWSELKLQYGANKGKAYTGTSPHSPRVMSRNICMRHLSSCSMLLNEGMVH